MDDSWAVAPPVRQRGLAAVQACFEEQDRYGQTLLHAAVKSKAAGFARLFVRLQQLSLQQHQRVGAMAHTLSLLKIQPAGVTPGAPGYGELNAATLVRMLQPPMLQFQRRRDSLHRLSFRLFRVSSAVRCLASPRRCGCSVLTFVIRLEAAVAGDSG